MGKTRTPLTILVIGDNEEQLMNSPEIMALIEKGDIVTHGCRDYDLVIGDKAIRAFPQTMQFVVKSVDEVRKQKNKLALELKKVLTAEKAEQQPLPMEVA